jgi:rhodanese-related sulfurtransferase
MIMPLRTIALQTLARVVVLLIVSSALAVAVNMVRDDPLPWTRDFSDYFLRQALKEGAVEAERAMELWNQQRAVFIDARSRQAYLDGHVPDALNLPYEPTEPGFIDRLTALPTEVTYVVYCDEASCSASRELAQTMDIYGYERVLVMAGGITSWTEAGGPLKESP